MRTESRFLVKGLYDDLLYSEIKRRSFTDGEELPSEGFNHPSQRCIKKFIIRIKQSSKDTERKQKVTVQRF